MHHLVVGLVEGGDQGIEVVFVLGAEVLEHLRLALRLQALVDHVAAAAGGPPPGVPPSGGPPGGPPPGGPPPGGPPPPGGRSPCSCMIRGIEDGSMIRPYFAQTAGIAARLPATIRGVTSLRYAS